MKTHWRVEATLPVLVGLCLVLASRQEAGGDGERRPNWWEVAGVIEPGAATRNYAMANLGQLRWMAGRAYTEFARVDFGTPPTMPSLGTNEDNFHAANIGQVKHLAKALWDRLRQIDDGYATQTLTHYQTPFWQHDYPWDPSKVLGSENRFAANVGQIKAAFAMDLDLDSDLDGLFDIHEVQLGGSTTSIDPAADSDGDGFSNLEEVLAGSDPTSSGSKPATGGGFEVYTNLE